MQISQHIGSAAIRSIFIPIFVIIMAMYSVEVASAKGCRGQARDQGLTPEEANQLCGDDGKGWPVRCYEQTQPGTRAPMSREKSLKFCEKMTSLWPVRCFEKIHAKLPYDQRIAGFCRPSVNLAPATCVVDALNDYSMTAEKAFEECKP